MPSSPAEDRAGRVQRGLRLEYFTIAYNTLEGLIATAFGLLAGSTALVGFGLDSIIEVISGATLIWRLRSDAGPAKRDRAERAALKIVGGCFLALAGYVAFEAAESLASGAAPQRSVPGILLAVASLIVMPALSRAKRRVAAGIGSAALAADAAQTQLCAYLSVILLIGLALNATLGWWWADPAAALVMTPIIAREGVSALRGNACHCTGSCP